MFWGILPDCVCWVIFPVLNSKTGMLYTSLPPLLLSTMKLQREKNRVSWKGRNTDVPLPSPYPLAPTAPLKVYRVYYKFQTGRCVPLRICCMQTYLTDKWIGLSPSSFSRPYWMLPPRLRQNNRHLRPHISKLGLGSNWVDIHFLFWPPVFQECVQDQTSARCLKCANEENNTRKCTFQAHCSLGVIIRQWQCNCVLWTSLW